MTIVSGDACPRCGEPALGRPRHRGRPRVPARHEVLRGARRALHRRERRAAPDGDGLLRHRRLAHRRRRRRGAPRRARPRVAGRARALRRAPHRAARAGASTPPTCAAAADRLYDELRARRRRRALRRPRREPGREVRRRRPRSACRCSSSSAPRASRAASSSASDARPASATSSRSTTSSADSPTTRRVTLPLRPPVDPDAREARRASCRPPARCSYEPKWDGFRCIVFRDGDDLDLQSRNSKPLLRYFPELREPLLEQLPERVVRRRRARRRERARPRLRRAAAAPAPGRCRASRSSRPRSRRRSSRSTCSRSATSRCASTPFRERRARARDGARATRTPPIHVTPATLDRDTAADWFDRFEGAGFDGVVAKPLDGTLPPGRAHDAQGQARAHRRLRRAPASACTRTATASARCCCGLYDDDGVAAPRRRRERHGGGAPRRAARRGRAAAQRRARGPSVAGLGRGDAAHAAAGSACPAARRAGTPTRTCRGSRCASKRVVEVAYEGLMNGRFRHNGRFRRWRPDKDPGALHLRASSRRSHRPSSARCSAEPERNALDSGARVSVRMVRVPAPRALDDLVDAVPRSPTEHFVGPAQCRRRPRPGSPARRPSLSTGISRPLDPAGDVDHLEHR